MPQARNIYFELSFDNQKNASPTAFDSTCTFDNQEHIEIEYANLSALNNVVLLVFRDALSDAKVRLFCAER